MNNGSLALIGSIVAAAVGANGQMYAILGSSVHTETPGTRALHCTVHCTHVCTYVHVHVCACVCVCVCAYTVQVH